MNLSHKQINIIKKQYPKKSAQQIADELHVPLSSVYRTLGLQNELWSMWIEHAVGILVLLLLLTAPFIFISGLHDFADLPQRVFIQTIASCLALLWALRVMINREIAIPRNPLLLIIAGLIIWSFVTLLWAVNVYEGFFSAIHIAACGAIFFTITTLLLDTKWIKWMLSASIISTAVVTIIGLCQHFLQFNGIPQSIPPAAVFGNPNVAADYLVIVLPVVICLGLSNKNILYRWSCFTIIILSLIFLYNTHSRGGWLALICSVLSMALLYALKKYNQGFIKKWLTIAVILLACLLPATLFTKSGNRIFNAALSEYRITAWRNSIEMIKDKPIQGFGEGNFQIFYPAYSHKAAVDKAIGQARYLGRAHNDYIQIAAELGIPGLLLFVLIPLSGLLISWRLLRQADIAFLYPVIIGLAGGLIAFMITACFSFPMQRSMPPLLIFTYCGILVILNYYPRLQSKNWIIRAPRFLGLGAAFCVLFTGFFLLHFNLNNIICERYYSEAMAMEKMGLDRNALSASLIANQYNTHRMDVLITMGRAYIATGELDRAIETLEKVISRYPYNLNALFFLGVAYANSDHQEKALETFRSVLQIKPDFIEVQKIICSLKAFGKARVSLS